VLVTIGVLASMVADRLGVAWADPVAALGVLVVVARVAWRILASNLGILVDQAVVDAATVRKLVEEVPGVTSCHRVRSRGMEGAVHLDLHLLVDGNLSVRNAHAITHRVEEMIRTQFADVADVTIHTEPAGDPEEDL